MNQNESHAWDAGYDLGYAEAAGDIASILDDLLEGLQHLAGAGPFLHVMQAVKEEFANRALCHRQKHQVHLYDVNNEL